jgi:hypothetical protein
MGSGGDILLYLSVYGCVFLEQLRDKLMMSFAPTATATHIACNLLQFITFFALLHAVSLPSYRPIITHNFFQSFRP